MALSGVIRVDAITHRFQASSDVHACLAREGSFDISDASGICSSVNGDYLACEKSMVDWGLLSTLVVGMTGLIM